MKYLPTIFLWQQIGINFFPKILKLYYSAIIQVSGSLTPKPDCEFIVKGTELIERNNKYEGCTSAAALKFLSVKLLLTNLLPLRYFQDFEKEVRF